jgi:hypothetical protein
MSATVCIPFFYSKSVGNVNRTTVKKSFTDFLYDRQQRTLTPSSRARRFPVGAVGRLTVRLDTLDVCIARERADARARQGRAEIRACLQGLGGLAADGRRTPQTAQYRQGDGRYWRRRGDHAEQEQVPPEGLAEVEVPFPVPDDAIAFEVQGESMWPRYDPGDIILCRNRERDPADLIGSEAAVRTTAGHRYLKRLRRGARKGIFDLESFNAELIRGVRIAWASEVHSVVRAGQWRTLNDAGKRRLLGGAQA